jgi:hypothetical protein
LRPNQSRARAEGRESKDRERGIFSSNFRHLC